MQNIWLPQDIWGSLDVATKRFIWVLSHPIGSIGKLFVNQNTKVTLGSDPLGRGILICWENTFGRLFKILLSLGNSIFHRREFLGSSCTWSSVIKAVGVLEPGYIFQAGQGDRSITLVWLLVYQRYHLERIGWCWGECSWC